jgi:hypothetical protein
MGHLENVNSKEPEEMKHKNSRFRGLRKKEVTWWDLEL